MISQSQIGNSLQKFKQCKKKFNNKKKLLAKAAHNYDLPLQSNENSKSSSLKDEFGKSKINLSKTDLQEIYSSNFKMETTNNLNYTPSNFESISFLESKNTKPS